MIDKKQSQSERNRRYRENHKDLIKKIQKEYYDNNREKRIKNAQKWVANNKEKALQTRRQYMKTPEGRLNSIKASANTRKIEFNLTKEQALDILHKNCFYCGVNENIGIDRIDNNIGYTPSNSRACCSICNYMKRIYSEKIFIEQCIKIAQNHS